MSTEQDNRAALAQPSPTPELEAIAQEMEPLPTEFAQVIEDHLQELLIKGEPAPELDPLGLAPHAAAFNEAPAEALKPAPELERPEVVAWQYRVTAGPQTGWILWHPGKGEEFERSYTIERRTLMTVAQHDRIVGALRDEISRIKTIADNYYAICVERQQQIDAAQFRGAELENQEPFCLLYRIDGEPVVQLVGDPHIKDGMALYADPVAQTGKVQDGYALVPVVPTPEMLKAACKVRVVAADGVDYMGADEAGEAYSAMIAAAPAQGGSTNE